jgi:hypothetical protein
VGFIEGECLFGLVDVCFEDGALAVVEGGA